MADAGGGSGEQQQQTGDVDLCMVCKKAEITYECMPCMHATLCKACAMKQATGGHCKKCGELFSELRRKRGNGEHDHDEEDEPRESAAGESAQEG